MKRAPGGFSRLGWRVTHENDVPRLAGFGKTGPMSYFGRLKRTAMAHKPRHCDLGFMQEGNWLTVSRKGEPEIENSGLEMQSRKPEW
jgi:hypothetical protein